jgi:hypothetical protein
MIYKNINIKMDIISHSDNKGESLNKYQSGDLYLSAYLLSMGFNFDYKKNSNNKTVFNFESAEDLNLHVNEYLTGRAKCDPLALVNAIKNLKNLLFNI